MNVLALETSSSILSVALKKTAGQITESSFEGALYHAENLLPTIDQMLKKQKLKLQDIHVFLIGRGPGSFTGLRIGFSTLKGFRMIQKINCYGAFSLDMIAENAELPEKSRLCVCLDARREKIYTRFYQRSRQKKWKPLQKPAVLSFSEFASSLNPGDFLIGDALGRYGEATKSYEKKLGLHLFKQSLWNPKASTLIRWFDSAKGEKGKTPLVKLEKPSEFLPFYFRLSEPEERKKAACQS